MKAKAILWTLALLLLCGGVSHAQMIPDDVGQSSNGLPPALANVGFDPQLNAQIPLDTPFEDEYGQPVTLRAYSGKKPLVMAFVYFTCPRHCRVLRARRPKRAGIS